MEVAAAKIRTVLCLGIDLSQHKRLEFQLGNVVPGAFTLVLAKHPKHLSLVDILSVGWIVCSGTSSR